MAENKDMESGNLLDKSEEKQAEKERNDANNANTIKNAADVAIASKNPYAVAIGGAIKAADKLTGGKSTELLGKNMTRNLKHKPGGKKLQEASNKLSESGAGDKIGQAASMSGGGGKGAAGAAEKGAAAKGAAEKGAAAKGAADNAKNAKNNIPSRKNKDDNDDSDDSRNKKEGKEKKKSKDKESKFSFLNLEEDEEGNTKLSIDFVGLIGKKYIIIGGGALLLLVIIISSFIASISTPASAAGKEMNEGTCVLGNDQNMGDDKCDEESPEAKAFHARVKELKDEYSEQGRDFNALYIAGFYVVVSNEKGSNLTYENFTKDKIRKIIDAMFDDSNAFDEDLFKNNLVNNILPNYISGKNKEYYKGIAERIFDFSARYIETYGLAEDGDTGTQGSDYATRLVAIAQKEFENYKPNSRGAKYRQWIWPGAGYFYWCATFVSWCANEAGIPKSIVTHSAAVDSFITQARNQHADHKPSSGYTPKPGDLVIWKQSLYPNSRFESHIGIVKKYDSSSKKLITIEGNSSDAVRQNTYNGISDVGIFFSPKYPKVTSTLTSTGSIKNGQSISIPQNFSQSMYTATGYDYWINSGRPMVWSAGTTQRKVSDLWKKKGSKFENGIAVLDGRYLIAVSETFGKTGEKVDVYLSNGKVLPCIIADAKSQNDSNITKWGHRSGNSINIVEFEIQRSVYKKYGTNPSNGKWNPSWHHKAVKIVNGGSIFKK